ncbi:hypothetical protein HYW17_00170 [Candidatus Uhrbacteria bacterium]|nr:hypothetical protein [Candidatus Uhrbacteria bacterium]
MSARKTLITGIAIALCSGSANADEQNVQLTTFCLPPPADTESGFRMDEVDYSSAVHQDLFGKIGNRVGELLDAGVSVDRISVRCRAGADARDASERVSNTLRSQRGISDKRAQNEWINRVAAQARANECAAQLRRALLRTFEARPLTENPELRRMLAYRMVTIESYGGKWSDGESWSGCPDDNSGRETVITVAVDPEVITVIKEQPKVVKTKVVKTIIREKATAGPPGKDGSRVILGASVDTLAGTLVKNAAIRARFGIADQRLEWGIEVGAVQSFTEERPGPTAQVYLGVPAWSFWRIHPFLAAEAFWLRLDGTADDRASGYLGKVGLSLRIPLLKPANPYCSLAIAGISISRSATRIQGAREITETDRDAAAGVSFGLGGEWR